MCTPMKIRVGLKFCGNCNPVIDSGKVRRELEGLIAKELMNDVELSSKDDPFLDVLVVISGCPVDCASRPDGSYKEIVVAGEAVNSLNSPQDELSWRAFEEIKKALAKGIRPSSART